MCLQTSQRHCVPVEEKTEEQKEESISDLSAIVRNKNHLVTLLTLLN